jgi:hypothetical protein
VRQVSCASAIDRRFSIQQVSEVTWLRATAANAAADYARGYRDVVHRFLDGRPGWEELAGRIGSSPVEETKSYADRVAGESLALLVLMLTGKCNADCPICFTDRRQKRDELTPEQRRDVLRQARDLGAQYVYVPGEGEPTLDAGWWDFLDTCRALELPAIVFTNAMIFGDDDLAGRTWGVAAADGARRLRDYPVYLYAKYWTPDPSLAAQLLGVPARRLPYGSYQDVPVPAGLQCLLETLPHERLGIEAVVERRTADHIAETIAPLTDRLGLARIIEMLQHNGRTFGDPSFDPTPEQVDRCQPLLSPTSCSLATCKAVVTAQGYLSPRIAILEHQLPDERRRVTDGDLYDLLHNADYLVTRRYNLDCLCESVPLELAGARDTITARAENVTAPALARTHPAARPAAATSRVSAGGCGASGCGSCGLCGVSGGHS